MNSRTCLLLYKWKQLCIFKVRNCKEKMDFEFILYDALRFSLLLGKEKTLPRKSKSTSNM